MSHIKKNIVLYKFGSNLLITHLYKINIKHKFMILFCIHICNDFIYLSGLKDNPYCRKLKEDVLLILGAYLILEKSCRLHIAMCIFLYRHKACVVTFII